MPLIMGILAQAAAAPGPTPGAGSYDLLETEILTGTQASVTFSSLNSTYGADYQHLQLRITARDTSAGTGGSKATLRFNGDTGSNYRERHYLYGDGSSVYSGDLGNDTYIIPYDNAATGDTADVYGAAVIDILDPFSSNKYTTTRSLRGFAASSGSFIGLNSGLWLNTAAITSITLGSRTSSLISGSRFSLYGLRSA